MVRTVITAGVAAVLALLLGACGGGDDGPDKRPETVKSKAGIPQELVGPWQVAEGEGSLLFDVDGTWTWAEPGCQAEGGFEVEGHELALTVTREGCGRTGGEVAWSIADSRLTLTKAGAAAEVYVRPPSET